MADDKPKNLVSELKQIDEGTGSAKTTASDNDQSNNVTPLKCFLGGIVAGVIAFFLYRSASGVALIFAQNQVQSDNFIVMRMSSAVRTLVIGMFAMGAGVFGMAAVGLTGLGIQTVLKKGNTATSDSASDS